MSKYKYRLKNENETLEDWSGKFDTLEEAQTWKEKHGIKFEKKGFKLVLTDAGQGNFR